MNVVAGGMRSITLVQALQYWFKLLAIALPVLVVLAVEPRPACRRCSAASWAEPGAGSAAPIRPPRSTR